MTMIFLRSFPTTLQLFPIRLAFLSQVSASQRAKNKIMRVTSFILFAKQGMDNTTKHRHP
jgi:hypothetical protein